ncbi:hypothetical protein HK097_000039 [Rhizophlyctis rosea]|uniref:T6SS Phospholipase effector Tle1-like catalytic domain-containing protein n=1 Tax=Rhizophlyctis rosea TaxID=64517 RepID=A0AAD5X950_9FUNG|nr:hypothetical protein HK097_000039 [Rhizophlyctis rosea]
MSNPMDSFRSFFKKIGDDISGTFANTNNNTNLNAVNSEAAKNNATSNSAANNMADKVTSATAKPDDDAKELKPIAPLPPSPFPEPAPAVAAEAAPGAPPSTAGDPTADAVIPPPTTAPAAAPAVQTAAAKSNGSFVAYKDGEISAWMPAEGYAIPPPTTDVKAPTPAGGRRLIICCDGTWSSAATGNNLPSMGGVAQHLGVTPTNIYKLAFLAGASDPLEEHPDQLVFYHSGVGASAKKENEDTFEGLFGNIDKDLQDVYRWLAAVYKPGDEIYAFGFSRGATVVRSLFGLIRNTGLPKREGLTDEAFDGVLHDSYEVYRQRPSHPEKDKEASDKFEQLAKEYREKYSWPKVNLKFLGVFDTVGELGVPVDFFLSGLIQRLGETFNVVQKASFHDTRVSDQVQYAYHAIAIDETRELFSPTLFEDVPKIPPATSRIIDREQVWFRGEHSDVGGGWFETGLSDIPLFWMIPKARACGVQLKDVSEWEKVARSKLMGVNEQYIKRNYKSYAVHDPFVGELKGTASFNERILRDFGYYQDPTRFYPSELHPSVFNLCLDFPVPMNVAHYLTRTDPEKLTLWPALPELSAEEKAKFEEERKSHLEQLEKKDEASGY